MFGSIGFSELALIFLIVILLFGPDKLPEFAKFFGKTVRTIKESVDDAKNTIKRELDDADVTRDIRSLGKELDPYRIEDSNEQPPK
jgi:Tat protein translocase TatB subunit